MTEKNNNNKEISKNGNGKGKVDLNNAIQQMSDNIEKLKKKKDEAFTTAEKEAITERINQMIMTMSYVTKSNKNRRRVQKVTEDLHKVIEEIIEGEQPSEQPILENEKVDRTKIGKGIDYYQPDLELSEQEKKEVWDLIENTFPKV